jgi:hypothetical protein
MFAAIVIRVFALISFPENDPTPWDSIEFVYKTQGKSVKGHMPWRTESLNPHGIYPTVIAKGF